MEFLLAILLLGLVVASIGLFIQNQTISRQRSTLNTLQAELDSLQPYVHVRDTDAEAQRIRTDAGTFAAQTRLDAERDAREELDKALAQARNVLNESDAERKRLIDEGQTELADAREEAMGLRKETRDKRKKAMERIETLKTKADSEIQQAAASAQRILEQAHEQAETIAGDAWKAKNQAEAYKKAARAMKNVVEGYGDEYVIPNHTVLDDLSDEFDHKEAGRRLKALRQQCKHMVRTGVAAECDYVETHRKQRAIRFVIDAFNGKVDSTLSRAKHDNYGKLRQEVLDAFDLVNLNGQAFRNARITQAYLDLRLEELEAAIATRELQRLEREEQRRIREEIREEERARREMERAIKQAEKEEANLEKAMAKFKARLEAAAADQKKAAKLQEQMRELQARLDDAETRKERALSMAQQTRRGHVYIISNIGSFGEGVVKIGMTRRLEPMDRVKELGDASVPFSFDVHAMIFSEDAPGLEKQLHNTFSDHRLNLVNHRKEFFRVPVSTLKDQIGDEDDVHWTLKAEAAEYRESEAMRRTMAEEAAATNTEAEEPAEAMS